MNKFKFVLPAAAVVLLSSCMFFLPQGFYDQIVNGNGNGNGSLMIHAATLNRYSTNYMFDYSDGDCGSGSEGAYTEQGSWCGITLDGSETRFTVTKDYGTAKAQTSPEYYVKNEVWVEWIPSTNYSVAPMNAPTNPTYSYNYYFHKPDSWPEGGVTIKATSITNDMTQLSGNWYYFGTSAYLSGMARFEPQYYTTPFYTNYLNGPKTNWIVPEPYWTISSNRPSDYYNSSTNLFVYNGGFESDWTDGWMTNYGYTGVTVYNSSAYYTEGSSSLQFGFSAAGYSMSINEDMNHLIPVTPDLCYEISFKALSETVSNDYSMTCTWYDASTNWLSSGYHNFYNYYESYNWFTVSKFFVVPANAAYLQIQLYISVQTVPSYIYIDDISVRELWYEP